MLKTRTLCSLLIGAAVVAGALACGGTSDTTSPAGTGVISLALTDAPFPFDSVKSVDAFVVRIDARQADADSTAADSHVDDANADGWTTLATPNRSIDLLALRNGKTQSLGEKSLANGSYRAFRLILDVTKSRVTLAD